MIRQALAALKLFISKPSVKEQFEQILEKAEAVIEEIKVEDKPATPVEKPKKPRKPRAKKPAAE